ncbi:CAP domain-containing protein [Streptomyces johnsoniae]|uniref:CAP domain-containing protein n=1 Tax=Streptomyces johnsoniae TaxID=3075532 RepID=A0ABU2RX58_9ACTN|nr:CAP domain-containing protein [Streptomyces sp. DSM 41886]MDT0441108.1 CAP domain-containing protein [Streptomyces sp. DSM 41886]
MGRHRRRRGHARTGLIGASAALAVGAVAVGTGLLPGVGDSLSLTDNDDVRAQDQRSRTEPPASPTPDPERTPREKPAEETPEPTEDPSPTEAAEPTEEPAREPEPEPTDPPAQETAPPEPEPTVPSPLPSEEPDPSPEPGSAEAEAVLSLVNDERSRAGCAPLTLDPALNALAAGHSEDMAERGYFDHTDPDGRTPWDRAAEAGVDNLGGENIARGQQDAQAVMDSWMSSEGHRANILNCDFTTLGLGVHFAGGGPWWTQNFGF